ncbi:sensor histidine kinase [Microvirga flavescens]|uniref:sensor histidine kinase n=1 Tax=Microvirga flavescens TaxID=2249811 RepID=UPI000DDC1E0A|nr:PAS domain-containing sensor histidine kinase [Microvirga flavescens]
MLTNSTWGWVDEWLEGVLPNPSGADPLSALPQQRFIVARCVAALAGLVALFPLALMQAASPGLLEAAVVMFVLSQIGAIAVALRFRSFAAARVLSAVTLAALVALAAFALSRSDTSSVGAEVLFGSGIALFFGHMAAHAFSVRRVEDALRRAALSGERREADLLSTIDDVVTWHDGMGAVLRASSGSVRVLGAPAATLRGIGLFQRIHVADRPAYLKALSDAAHGSKSARARLRVRSGASEAEPATVLLDMRAYRLPHSDDEKAIVVSVMRDIGEHQDELDGIEAARREAVAEAEHRAQLLDMAGRALRKPLNDIHGYARLMTGRGALVHRKDYADVMRKTSERMTETVGAFLELASVESGSRALAYEAVDVAACLDECCESLMEVSRQARVTIRREVSSALPLIHADRKALGQIFHHALSNVLMRAEEGGEVAVDARVDGRNLSFSIGVSRRSFDAIKNAQDPEVELRLALVRALVVLHGGHVSVSDGAGIHIDLPIEAGRSLATDDGSNVRSIIDSDPGVHFLKAG